VSERRRVIGAPSAPTILPSPVHGCEQLRAATEAKVSDGISLFPPNILSKRSRSHNRGGYRAPKLSAWRIRDHQRRTHEVHPMLWLLYQRQGLIIQTSNTLADVAPRFLMIAVNQQFSPFEFRVAGSLRRVQVGPGIRSSWEAMFRRVWMYEQKGGPMSLEQLQAEIRSEFDEIERAASHRQPEIVERRFDGIPGLDAVKSRP
jgi:hypothetical protein